MEMKYEGISKENRKEFKYFMDYPKVRYNFKNDTAIITMEEDYIITEKSMQNKNDFKRAMQQGIIEFRNYCFKK